MTRELAEDVSEFERRRVEELLARTPRLSERWPALYPVSVWVHRARRRLQPPPRQLARRRPPHPARRDVLVQPYGRELHGAQGVRDGDAAAQRRGHSGLGGGICQLGNLIHWLALHSDLTVAERSEHSFDPFPDKGRVLPWGTGVSIVYNYVDLVLRNDTDTTFQISVTVGDTYLEGELRADRPQPRSYKVYAACERFFRANCEYFRTNQLRRRVIDKATGDQIGDELVRENCALVRYVPTNVGIIDRAA